VLTSTLAAADTAKDVTKALDSIVSSAGPAPENIGVPRFALTDGSPAASPSNIDQARVGMPENAASKKPVVGISADKTAVWINADVAEEIVCRDMGCDQEKAKGWWHATALFEVKGPTIVAWQIAKTVAGKDQAAAIKKGVSLDGLDERVDKGSEDPVKLFKDTLGDPKKLAATVSDRKDAVMYGSELGERFVGGAKIKSQLAKWNLGFTVTGGVQSGLTKSQTVAFVAANVEAKSMKNPKAAASPYRVFAIYEKTVLSWRLVSLHFAFTSS
jgi:hypothetical protein